VDLTKNVEVVVYLLSLRLGVLEVQFGKSKSFKWKRDWGCCDRKSWAACAQTFAPRQQTTI